MRVDPYRERHNFDSFWIIRFVKMVGNNNDRGKRWGENNEKFLSLGEKE